MADREQNLTLGELADLAGLDRPQEPDGDPSAEASPDGTVIDRSEKFRALLRTHHPDLADGLLTLLEKWEAEGGWFGYGAAEETSCAPMLREGSGPQGALWPVTVYPRTGVVEVVFAYLARREPFTRLGLLVELRDRLRTIPGVTLTTPDAELPRRRPNFPLGVLRGDGLIRFAETLERFRQQSL